MNSPIIVVPLGEFDHAPFSVNTANSANCFNFECMSQNTNFAGSDGGSGGPGPPVGQLG